LEFCFCAIAPAANTSTEAAVPMNSAARIVFMRFLPFELYELGESCQMGFIASSFPEV
jgi:hypothetical protein